MADNRKSTTEADLKAITIGAPQRIDGQIVLVDYNPNWPKLFAAEERRIRAALGDRVLSLEHMGSTSVPGLCAKPIIDITMAVANAADEANYVPPLEAAGYVLRIREHDWHQHRMFKGPDTNLNLHVYSLGCPEIDFVIRFRDWLRTHDEDRDLYAAEKRRLAAQTWAFTQNYADAKSEIVQSILARAMGNHAASNA